MYPRFSPDGKWLLSGSDDFTLRVWETVTGQEVHRLGGMSGPVLDIAVTPDSKTAITGGDAHTVLIGPKTAQQVEDSVRAVEKGPLPGDVLRRLDAIAALVPFRPFEEPMILPFNRPHEYHGPGMANVGAGVKVGKP